MSLASRSDHQGGECNRIGYGRYGGGQRGSGLERNGRTESGEGMIRMVGGRKAGRGWEGGTTTGQDGRGYSHSGTRRGKQEGAQGWEVRVRGGMGMGRI
jgi:hypothetical protein